MTYKNLGMGSLDINRVNLLLLLVSFVLACILPFELFLFSYAVLGPLHYFTEINWLHQKQYFVQHKNWIIAFAAVSLLLTFPLVLKIPLFFYIKQTLPVKWFRYHQLQIQAVLLFALFLMSILLVLASHRKNKVLYFLLMIALALGIVLTVPFSVLFAGLLLPSVIHVYLFTFLFMLFGALQENNKLGILTAFLLLLSPLTIAFLPIQPDAYNMGAATQRAFMGSAFQRILQRMAQWFISPDQQPFQLISMIGIRLQIFLAFCYTYHYLNWFSKTNVIGWARSLSVKKWSWVLLLWFAIMALFARDYELGYAALFFLSTLHVVLEFPLNITSIKGIVVLSKQRLIRRGA